MQHVIAILLPEDDQIEAFRDRYHPGAVQPHITLVYEFDEQDVEEHIRSVTSDTDPFEVTLTAPQQSPNGHYLYLVPHDDRQLMSLHRLLKTGPLQSVENPEMTFYVPHLTIGKFESEAELKEAVQDALLLSQTVTIDTVWLLSFEDDELVDKQEFKLGE